MRQLEFEIRKYALFFEEIILEGGVADGGSPLRKVCAAAVIKNPYAGRYQDDLSSIVNASSNLGNELASRAITALGDEQPQSYGKAALIGAAGDQEVAVAFLTTAFAAPMRELAGGGEAWISSVTKRGGPGASLDVPLAHKDDLYMRSHYDAITIRIADVPLSDEVLVCCAFSNRGRINARLGRANPVRSGVAAKAGRRPGNAAEPAH